MIAINWPMPHRTLAAANSHRARHDLEVVARNGVADPPNLGAPLHQRDHRNGFHWSHEKQSCSCRLVERAERVSVTLSGGPAR
jgi:hypothetical protein